MNKPEAKRERDQVKVIQTIQTMHPKHINVEDLLKQAQDVRKTFNFEDFKTEQPR